MWASLASGFLIGCFALRRGEILTSKLECFVLEVDPTLDREPVAGFSEVHRARGVNQCVHAIRRQAHLVEVASLKGQEGGG